MGESGGYDGSGEYNGSVGPCESDSGDPFDTYESGDEPDMIFVTSITSTASVKLFPLG